MAITVTAQGPLFDGRAQLEVSHFLDDSIDLVAARAEENVDVNLATSLRHPTGHYQSNINTRREGLTQVVNDSGVIYGAWLEGVGSRNSPVTRFKGYFSFRRAEQATDARVPEIVRPGLDRLMREVNE